QFFQALVDQLKLSKELALAIDNLKLHGRERDIRIAELALQQAKADIELQKVQGVADLELELAQKKIRLNIAKIDKEMEDLNKKREPNTSPAEERGRRHTESEARLENLKAELQRAMHLSDEDERMRKCNAINDAIQRETIEWSKTL